MGVGQFFDNVLMDSSKAINGFSGRFSSAASRAKPIGDYMGKVGSTLKSTYGTGGFALKAGLYAAAGAGAGYAYDGTDSSAIKGGLLGAAGAAVSSGWKSPSMRGLASEAMGAGKSAWSDARGWAGKQYSRQVNAAHVRTAGRAGWSQ